MIRSIIPFVAAVGKPASLLARASRIGIRAAGTGLGRARYSTDETANLAPFRVRLFRASRGNCQAASERRGGRAACEFSVYLRTMT
ncbi:MAG: hypothetical protein BJ554DRAFT_6448 [Olpidium bornovanus]|uniref:Uncharacterized protein n=1 Tax=Olpidium bornovanus TaxID=278681 RepID=A0A8H7ZXX5_9FUNG|nr:MAG: hypothetical protein BJ554DRAFT_6448 [Olpidium bornovanus]